MNLTVKRCLLGLVAWATLFGIARAQFQDPAGTVQLGTPAYNGGQALPPSPTQVSDFGAQPVPGGTGAIYGMTQVDRLFAPRVNIDSRGGGLYGYQAGYSNIGVFAPYKLEENAILFVHGMGLITYDGRGGATVGTGWRYWMEGIDRIVGLSVWFDFDNGHAQPYQQVGLSFESLGRYVDYRVNGYIPISNADHVLNTQLTNTAFLNGNMISLLRNNTVEQSYTGFDAEMGGPTPILGRYGLNAYIGGYFFNGNGQRGGDFTGVSGRLLSQINEDLSFGVQVTNDHLFGLNTQFQVFANLPDGKPSRWFRNACVRDRLVQNVFRQNRVIARTDSFQTSDAAIDPKTHRPYFVANIDPNSATGGNGTFTNPFNSVAQYESVSLAQRQQYDIVRVVPRADSTTTNLDTSTTLQLFDGQRLLSSSLNHVFTTENIANTAITLPGFTGGSAPMLFNSTGGDVITLTGGNSSCYQVSGFEIIGSATGNGIRGNNNQFTIIDNNNIHSGLNGVLLTNLSGTIAAGTEFHLFNNNIHDNVSDGVQVTNAGSPPAVGPLDVVVQGNIFNNNGHDGLQFVAQAGGTIGGIIGGPSTAAVNPLSNTFENNKFNGLDLIANGGTLSFQSPATTTTTTALFGVPNNAFGIYDNIFTSNTLDGLHIDTKNNSLSNFLVINNHFGTAAVPTSGNLQYGIGLLSDSGITNITIGGALVTNPDGTTTNPGNTFNFNAVSAINLAVSGTGTLNYDIGNNTISNSASSTVAAPHDSFTFLFSGTSGTDPFTITNTSDPGIDISSVTWNLTGTPATIAATNQGVTGSTNPVVLQPISDSLLTSLNGIPVIAGSSPLVISASNLPANNARSGLAAGSQLLPMGFTGFAPNDVFNATARFEQSAGSSPLTSAATNNSSITVNFSNGLSTTQKVAQLNAASNAVSASGDVFGASTPGFGSGTDGIHVIASGNSNLGKSTIHDNSVTGYGNFGIHVETTGSANAPNVIVSNNVVTSNGSGVNGSGTSVFSGGGIDISRSDRSSLNAYLANNTVNANFNDGIVLSASGTATGGLSVYSRDNTAINNAGNGLKVTSSDAARLTYISNRDNFTGNGSGSAKNPAVTGGDNIAFTMNGTSVATITLHNVLANSSSGSGLTSLNSTTGNGLSATTNDSSTLNLLIDSPTDPMFTGTNSSFSSNRLDGLLFNSNATSFLHLNIYNTSINSNVQDGIAFNRNAASLVLANITASTASSNGRNGFFYQGLGSDPADPTQQFSGTPNRINLNQDSFNSNGKILSNGVLTGDGAHVNVFGQSVLVLNALGSSFSNNTANGLRVDETPGAQFGYTVTNERSTFDNVTITGNGANGIMFTSTTSTSIASAGTFFDLNSVHGNTIVSNNTGDGMLLQYVTGIHDVLVRGDGRATPLYGTFIQTNGGDGIHADIGLFADATLTVDGAIIGGSTAGAGNKKNGIDFEPTSAFRVLDSNATLTSPAFTDWTFNTAGFGTLNVNNTLIEFNGQNGINLVGNALSAIGLTFDANGVIATRTRNNLNDAWGQLNANVTNSMITHNALDGVNIQLLGRMGGDHSGFFGPSGQNTITFSNNMIASNGNYGIFLEQNAGEQVRDFAGDLYRRERFLNPVLTPPGPLNPNLLNTFAFNTGNNTDIVGGFALSNWMNLETVQATVFTLTNNQIVNNGTTPSLSLGDGVKIRQGTDSYLAADIRNNKIAGNVGTDFYIESFDAYNPATKVVPPIPASAAATPPALSTVFLDDTAQLDMRFTGNIGNTINIVSPFNNFNGTLPGNVSPNGAIYPAEGLKDRFSLANPSPRLTQLFELDDGQNVDANNVFSSNGTQQNLFNEFKFASWHLRTIADPLFPNPAFPQDFFTSPGDPFLP